MKTFIIFLLLFVTKFVFGHTINGIVVDSISNNPLKNVKVKFYNDKYKLITVKTTEEGKFNLINLTLEEIKKLNIKITYVDENNVKNHKIITNKEMLCIQDFLKFSKTIFINDIYLELKIPYSQVLPHQIITKTKNDSIPQNSFLVIGNLYNLNTQQNLTYPIKIQLSKNNQTIKRCYSNSKGEFELLVNNPQEGNYRLTIENADALIEDSIFKSFNFNYVAKQSNRFNFDVQLPFYELVDNLYTQRKTRAQLHIKCDFNGHERMKAHELKLNNEKAINTLLMNNGTPADKESNSINTNSK
jgi:hypothetical protein